MKCIQDRKKKERIQADRFEAKEEDSKIDKAVQTIGRINGGMVLAMLLANATAQGSLSF